MIITLLAAAWLWFPPKGGNCATRPKITGIAHVRVQAASLEDAKKFYGYILGLPAAKAHCTEAQFCLAVNREQQVEVVPLSKRAPSNLLAEIAFATDNAEQMRCYLQTHNVKTGALSEAANGSKHFELLDPEGHPIAFVQGESDPTFKPGANQVSTRLLHAGFVVRDRAIEDRFYLDVLGFRPYWHGGFKDTDTDWEEIQVPDGTDWVEYMLNISSTADRKELGVQNHLSLGVKSAKAAVQEVRGRGLQNTDGPEIGRDGKWSADIYDPDATRVELMEFVPAQAPCCDPYTASHPKP